MTDYRASALLYAFSTLACLAHCEQRSALGHSDRPGVHTRLHRADRAGQPASFLSSGIAYD